MSTALSTLLVQDKLVSFIQMDEALRRVDEHGGTLDTALLELDGFDEGSLLVYLSRAWHRSPIAPDDYVDINPGVVGLISAQDAERLGIVPVRFEGDVLVVAVSEPLDEDALDALVARTGGDVEERITPELRLREALNVYYDVPLSDRFKELLRRRPSPLASRRAAKDRPKPVQAPVYNEHAATLPGYNWSTAELAAFYRASEERDHVLLATLGFTGRFFRRRVLFAVGRTAIRGFALQGVDEPAREIREFRLDYGENDLLHGICHNGQYFFGDPREAGVLDLYDHLGVLAPVECMIFPISVGPRAALLILGDDVGDHIDPGVAPLILAIVRPLGEKLKDLIRQRRERPRADRPSADIVAQTARTSMQATQLIAALQESDESVAQRGLNEIPTDGWDFPDLEELAIQMDRRTRHRDIATETPADTGASKTSPTSMAGASAGPVNEELEAELRRFEAARTTETPTVDEIRAAQHAARYAEAAATHQEDDPAPELAEPSAPDAGATPDAQTPDPGASSPGVNDNVAAVLSTMGRETGWDLGDEVDALVDDVFGADEPVIDLASSEREPAEPESTQSYDALLNPDGQDGGRSLLDEPGNDEVTQALSEAAAASSEWDALLDPDAPSTRRMVAIEGDPRAPEQNAAAVSEAAAATPETAPEQDLAAAPHVTTQRLVDPDLEPPVDFHVEVEEPHEETTASPNDSSMEVRANGVVTGYSVATGSLDRPEMDPHLPSIEIDISAFHFDTDEDAGKTEKMEDFDIPISLDVYDEEHVAPREEEVVKPGPSTGAETLMMSAVPDRFPVASDKPSTVLVAEPDAAPAPEETVVVAEPDPTPDAPQVVEAIAEPEPAPLAVVSTPVEEVPSSVAVATPEETAPIATPTEPAAAPVESPTIEPAAISPERVAPTPEPTSIPAEVVVAHAEPDAAPHPGTTLPSGTMKLGAIELVKRAVPVEEIPFIAPEAIEPVVPSPAPLSGMEDTAAIGVVTDEMVSRVVGMQTTIDEPLPRPTTKSDDEWIALLQSNDPAEQEAGYNALSERGEDAFPAILANFPGRIDVDYRSPTALDVPLSEHGPLVAYAAEIIAHLAPYLLPLLEVRDPSVRFYATLLLTRVRLDEAVQPVAKRVFDTEAAVRTVALRVLEGHRRAPGFLAALNMIRSRVYDVNTSRADLAIVACATLNDTEVVSSLIELLGEGAPQLRGRAQSALERLTFQDFGDSRRRWERWYRKNGDDRREQWLIDAMVDKDRVVRMNAARALRSMPDVVVNYNPDMDRNAQLAAQQIVVNHFTRRW